MKITINARANFVNGRRVAFSKKAEVSDEEFALIKQCAEKNDEKLDALEGESKELYDRLYSACKTKADKIGNGESKYPTPKELKDIKIVRCQEPTTVSSITLYYGERTTPKPNVQPIINIVLDDTGCDGRKPMLIIRDDNYPEIDNALKQQFLEMTAPLELKNPEGAYLLAHHIKFGKIIDDDEMAQWVKPNECDWEILSLMEMLLNIRPWKDVESVRVGYVLKGDGKTRSISLNNMKFYEELTRAVMTVYLEKFAPTYIVKGYVRRKYEWRDIMKYEVARLRKLREFSARRLRHRPTSNKKIYCMLLLFFDILGVMPNKPNCNLMIQILQLMGLWKEEQKIDDSSYKLIIRQWKTAQMNKLLMRKIDFPNRDVDFAGMEGLSFR